MRFGGFTAKRVGRLWALGTLFLTACSATATVTETVGPTEVLLPYTTNTPTRTPVAIEEDAGLPTATPQLYTVKQGDTMFDIAALHGLTVAQLQAANPGVDPRLLSPGTELVIPLADVTAMASGTSIVSIESPTAVAVQSDEVTCYATALGELWCFLVIRNSNAFSVESVIGSIQLLDANGEVLSTVAATPPLDVLRPDQAMPLVAYLEQAPEGWAAGRGQVVSAFELAADDEYYLNAELIETDVDNAEGGRSARVLGEVQLGGQEPEVLWVLAVAYGVDGKVAGFSKWESDGEREFYFYVYSLGPQIERVELLVEAISKQ